MENKVYVLIMCESTVYEEYDGTLKSDRHDPEVVGIYKTVDELSEKLDKLEFSEHDIKRFLNHKCIEFFYTNYYLREVELN